MIRTVVIGRLAQRQLQKVPRHIASKLKLWVEAVEAAGVEAVRRITGFHDEPCQADRRGQRSIRLSRSYRAYYAIVDDGTIEFIRVEEVNKHDY